MLPPRHTDSEAVEKFLGKTRFSRFYSDKNKSDYELICEQKKAMNSYPYVFLFPFISMIDRSNDEFGYWVLYIIICFTFGTYMWLCSRRIDEIYNQFIQNHHNYWKDIKS